MKENKMDLAIEIIRQKIAKEIKQNKYKNYSELKKQIFILRQEEREIYKQNDKIINKVLTEYAKDIKNINEDI